jgi:hypothetical protein
VASEFGVKHVTGPLAGNTSFGVVGGVRKSQSKISSVAVSIDCDSCLHTSKTFI